MTTIMSIFCAFFNNEIYNNIYIFDEDRNAIRPSVWEDKFYAVYIVVSFFLILKPVALTSMVCNHSKGSYFSLKIVIEFVIVLIASVFTELTSSIQTT
jgi:hypothetical protein